MRQQTFYFVHQTNPSTPNQLLDDLNALNPTALQYVYTTVRPQVQSAVREAGGSMADGNVFFQAALIDLARWHRDEKPEDAAMGHLEGLAIAHFLDWKKNIITSPENLATKEAPIESDAQHREPTPVTTDFAATRSHIYVWKTLSKLSSGCKASLMQQPVDEDTTCKTELVQALRHKEGEPADTQASLPDYARAALERKIDFQIWSAMRQYEQYTEQGLQLDGTPPNRRASRVANYIVFSLLLLTTGYTAYNWYTRPKTAKQVFEQNFRPPESLLADINRHYENDSSGIVRPERCQAQFAAADEHYKKEEYAEAIDPLVSIIQDDDLQLCHSDAYFGLALISLKREDPEMAKQCLVKIDNLEAFGEDLYWYQALAYVQAVKIGEGDRTEARDVVQRALENTQIEERRLQAQKMLEQLK